MKLSTKVKYLPLDKKQTLVIWMIFYLFFFSLNWLVCLPPIAEEYQVPLSLLHFILGIASAFCNRGADAESGLKDLLKTTGEISRQAEGHTWIQAAGQCFAIYFI